MCQVSRHVLVGGAGRLSVVANNAPQRNGIVDTGQARQTNVTYLGSGDTQLGNYKHCPMSMDDKMCLKYWVHCHTYLHAKLTLHMGTSQCKVNGVQLRILHSNFMHSFAYFWTISGPTSPSFLWIWLARFNLSIF